MHVLVTASLTFSTYSSIMNSNNPDAAARAAWLSQFPKTKTTRSKSWACVSLVVVMAVVVGFMGVVMAVVDPVGEVLTSISTDLPWSQRGDCYRILTPASFIKSFPLPDPINKTAHQVVLNEIGWPEPDRLLSSLVNRRSLVCSHLSASISSIQDFVKHLAYTCSESKYRNMAFYDTIRVTHQQFELTLIEIDGLAALYASMKDSYHKLSSSATEALKKGQLSDREQTLIKNQPSNLKSHGIDFYRWWGLPFREKVRKSEAARSGITALNRESQTLEQIGLVFRELKRSVELLIVSVTQWDTELDDDGIPRQERLQEWFQQNIHQNQKLEKLWFKLLELVDDEEERLLIEITPDWCRQRDFNSGDASDIGNGRVFPSFIPQ